MQKSWGAPAQMQQIDVLRYLRRRAGDQRSADRQHVGVVSQSSPVGELAQRCAGAS
jgi:hypothetical protein